MNRRLSAISIAMLVLLVLGGRMSAGAGAPAASKTDLNTLQVLDLEKAAQIALAENPSLAVARARVAQARDAIRQAQAAYWPRVDLSASGSRVDQSESTLNQQFGWLQDSFGISVNVENPQDYYSVALRASWVVFDGFARKFALASARHAEQSSIAARQDAQRLLLQAVANSFLSAQFALENIAIAKADMDFNLRQHQEAKLRYDVGAGALSAVLNFQIRVNSAESTLIQAERVYQTSRIGLAALLGLPRAELPSHVRLAPLAPVTESQMASVPLDRIVPAAIRQRPDLQRNQYNILQAEAEVSRTRADFYPTVSLLGSYEGERADDIEFEGDDFGSTVAIQLSYNIFAGGLHQARHQQAKSRLREVQSATEDLRLSVASEVRNARERVAAAQKQLMLQRDNVDLVQRNRDLVEKEYNAGVASLVRLNEAQRDLTAAQVNLASSRTALHQAWYDLQAAAGMIREEFGLDPLKE